MNKRRSRAKDYFAVTVSFTATPIADPPAIGQWASIVVWTESMLTTLLENKVRGGKWYTLYDKVWIQRNLSLAAHNVVAKKGAAGVDRQTVDKFWMDHQEELSQLQQELKAETYRPAPVRRVEIPKPGSQEKRPLGIPFRTSQVTPNLLPLPPLPHPGGGSILGCRTRSIFDCHFHLVG